MKKRLILIVLAACFVLTAALPASGAMSLSNFSRYREYRGEFSDISLSAWYYDSVSSMFEYGIMDGKGAGMFDPSGSLTIAETIKLAASLHKGYHTGSMEFEPGSPWYAPYVDYARRNNIPVGAYRNLSATATRADFALIIAGALPDEAITPINRIADGAIPDVWESYSYGHAVYRLYRAGVLTGSDSEGTFFPGMPLRRAEAAAIIARVVDAGKRAQLALSPVLTGEQIYKLASPAVFFVEVFDSEDELVKTGSGFFISESGLAVTNYHVVIGATSVKITTSDGEVLDVVGIYDYNWKKDAALIRVEGRGFPYLELADYSRLLTGATVYALGSPLGLQASFSKGIVSQAMREIEGTKYIQLDASISSGSSGGALLDTSGKVIGATNATMLGAQNINLAVPIDFFTELRREWLVPFDSILIPVEYYEGFYPAPDFGAHYKVSPFSTENARPSGKTFSYRVSGLPDDIEKIIDDYAHLVEQNFFVRTGTLTRGDHDFRVYQNSKNNVTLTFGVEEVRGRDNFAITVS